MTYSDFSLQTVLETFNLHGKQERLFENVVPVGVPQWLQDMLERGRAFAHSEKARSEFLVAPILLCVREQSGGVIAIFSGQRMDVAPDKGLSGECDFIIAKTSPFPVLRSPILTIVEAKKHDVEAGWGQCAAQLIGAQLFNQNKQGSIATLFGCVTTGETWHFLKLEDDTLVLDSDYYYIANLDVILGVFQAILL